MDDIVYIFNYYRLTFRPKYLREESDLICVLYLEDHIIFQSINKEFDPMFVRGPNSLLEELIWHWRCTCPR